VRHEGIINFSSDTHLENHSCVVITQLQFQLFSWPEFKWSYVSADFISSALSIAFVALLETLISAKIADSMTKTTFNQRKEVFGLSLANILTGLIPCCLLSLSFLPT